MTEEHGTHAEAAGAAGATGTPSDPETVDPPETVETAAHAGGAGEDKVGAPPAGSDALEDVTGEANAQLEALQRELEALNDRHLRLAAEFDNYRKRVDRERAEIRARAQAELVKGLLDTLDDLQRVATIDVSTTTAEALAEGILLIEKKLRHALESAGLEPIHAEGEFFNPLTMEAVATVETDRPEEDDAVADVFQKGYRFKDHLIRPARVRVRKYGL